MTPGGRAVLGVAALGVAGLCGLWSRRPAVRLDRDVPYARRGGKTLALDVARPRSGEGPFPALICIHGGGWQGGDKKDCGPFLRPFARRGYVTVAVQYRLAPADKFPAQLEDVEDALSYVRARAKELKVDPGRIGAVGMSAGGHLALLLGLTGRDRGVRAVASIAGPTDLSRPFSEPLEPVLAALLGRSKDRDLEAFRKASPVAYVGPGSPPMLLVHGTADDIVPYEQARTFAEACAKAGAPVELVTIPDGGHGGGGRKGDWDRARKRMAEFFDENLRPIKGF